MDKIKIKEAIIVEGVYDKIKLMQAVDAFIISTHGFAVFRNKDILKTIQKMAEETGIVIFTDSDSAGFKIRNFIKQSVRKGRVYHAYIPDIPGKEKRKRTPGKEGILGVEGVDNNIIINALIQSGCTVDGNFALKENDIRITKADLVRMGLSGGKDSARVRHEVSKALGIPMKISANMLLDALNRMVSYEELCEIVQSISEKK